MTKKVEAERLGRWLKDPITRMYMEDLERLKDELIKECGAGGCNVTTGPTVEQMYQYFQGAISAINTAADVKSLMAERLGGEDE